MPLGVTLKWAGEVNQLSVVLADHIVLNAHTLKILHIYFKLIICCTKHKIQMAEKILRKSVLPPSPLSEPGNCYHHKYFMKCFIITAQ